MCTAISYGNYFGRNLDLERGYGERVVITPRNYRFKMRCVDDLENHYAFIGMAAVVGEYPLYFDAMNEKGLCMAGLNFPNNAVFHPLCEGKLNIATFEFIPYILGKCQNISEAEALLFKINLVNINFSDNLPNSPLHWIISDGERTLTVESVKDGLKVYENTVGVLTNNPPFLQQIENYRKYIEIFNAKIPQNNGGHSYSLGYDGVGIPGDFSSSSRFVKAAFVKHRLPQNLIGQAAVNHFFHILGSVAMPKGCVLTPSGECEYTRYSCCCDRENGEYYYTTYDNCQMMQAAMGNYDLENNKLYMCEQI